MPGAYSDLEVVREISAVKINQSDGTPGPLFRIPPRSSVRVRRASMMPNMVEIEWQGESYAVFEVDLHERTTPATAGGLMAYGRFRSA
jgi:hypothetical protein